MSPLLHPIAEIEALRQLYADHSCPRCKKKDKQHWFYPKSIYKGHPVTWEFCNLQCVDWPNVEYVCWEWHHMVFNPEYDRPWKAPAVPPFALMQTAVTNHYQRRCGCWLPITGGETDGPAG